MDTYTLSDFNTVTTLSPFKLNARLDFRRRNINKVTSVITYRIGYIIMAATKLSTLLQNQVFPSGVTPAVSPIAVAINTTHGGIGSYISTANITSLPGTWQSMTVGSGDSNGESLFVRIA